MRRVVRALGCAWLLLWSGTAAAVEPIDIHDDFADGKDGEDWPGPEVNVTTDAAHGLMLSDKGALGHIDTGDLTDKGPDVNTGADVDLGSGWAVRSVTITVKRKNSSSATSTYFATLTAYKEQRDSATTRVRLRVGKVGGDTKEALFDDTTSGHLALNINAGGTGKAKATFPGAEVEVDLSAEDEVVLMRLDIQGDPQLATPSIRRFDATSPPP